MSFDGLVTSAVTRELSSKLTGCKIEKVYQPSADEIFLSIRGGGEKYRLYLSANTTHAGIYLTSEKSLNPQNPPAFCMLLRKHLQSARIREIRQVDSERIIEIYTDATNELGFDVKYKLIIEIMGKHSNILLIDLGTGRIVDCIKRISGDVNRYRQTLPGLMYVAPPSQNKLPYFHLDYNEFEALYIENGFEKDPEKALVKTIMGISPLMASELLYRARKALQSKNTYIHYPVENSDKSLTSDAGSYHSAFSGDSSSADSSDYFSSNNEELMKAVYSELVKVVSEISQGNMSPTLYADANCAPCDFHAVMIETLASEYSVTEFETVSEACEKYFEGRSSSNRIRQKASNIRKTVSAALDKMLLKKQRLSEDLMRAENSEDYRLYGELLTASLHSVKDGRSEAEVLNYYTGEMLTIPLDPRFSASKNAQRYFKKYAKAKTAVTEKKIQLEETEREIDYLDSVLTFIDNTDKAEGLEDIRAELIENGILKRRNQKERLRKVNPKPMEFFTSTGKRILVGKNNKENDILTFKTASSTDYWFHTKDIPGSHVILFTDGEEPNESEIFEAAALAARFSKAKMSGNVPVDYVRAKYVKKPSGAKPGYVIFTNNNTVYTDPAVLDDNK